MAATHILNVDSALGHTLRLQFSVAGVPFTALIEPGADGADLTLTGDFGPLPFTAQSGRMRETLLRLGREKLGRVRVASGRIEIEHTRRVARPSFATEIVAMLVEAVLDCRRDSARLAALLAESNLDSPAQHAA
jgi:hypothetical protein